MAKQTKIAISTAKYKADQARIDAKMRADRYKAQPVENYQPLYKELNRLYPTKNFNLED